jgi:hypothetical protein
VSVRLVGPASDESWSPSGAIEDPGAVVSSTADAAGWVAERAMKADGPRGELSLLCVDVEGGTCGWLTSPSADSSVVAAAMAQGGGEWAGAGTDAAAAGGAWAPATPNDSSVQALAAPTVKVRQPLRFKRGVVAPRAVAQKFAVVAVPDVDARLFVDALDERGVSVERAVSLWHAAAMAWDPAFASGPSLKGDVVASSAPTSAVVLIDPTGRLVWAWSRAGELLAAGTIRLAQDRQGDVAEVVMGMADVGRLTADWISWSVQIGVSPARVVCVGPRIGGAGGHDALSPAALGTALGKAWPGATVDLAVHDDPIGATLQRLSAQEAALTGDGDGRSSLVSLTARPGRAHRSMYRWGALCVVALAAAFGAVAWKSLSAAGAARQKLSDAKAEAGATVIKLMKDSGTNLSAIDQATVESSPRDYLTQAITRKRQTMNPNSGLDPAKPILQELETLSYVLGVKGVEISEISLMNATVMVYVEVPDLKTGEEVKAGLDSVSNSHVEWGAPTFSPPKNGKQGVSVNGRWKSAGVKP